MSSKSTIKFIIRGRRKIKKHYLEQLQIFNNAPYLKCPFSKQQTEDMYICNRYKVPVPMPCEAYYLTSLGDQLNIELMCGAIMRVDGIEAKVVSYNLGALSSHGQRQKLIEYIQKVKKLK